MSGLMKLLLLLIGGGAIMPLLEAPAWTYMDTVGQIWSQEQGGYFNAPEGQIGVYVETAPFYGGVYFNRQ